MGLKECFPLRKKRLGGYALLGTWAGLCVCSNQRVDWSADESFAHVKVSHATPSHADKSSRVIPACELAFSFYPTGKAY